MADDDFVKGLDGLLEELKGLPGNIEANALRASVLEAAHLMSGVVAQEAPISSPEDAQRRGGRFKGLAPGYLKQSFHAKKVRPKKGEVAAGVKGAFYAKMVEFGHLLKSHGKNGRTIGHVPANNFIRRAFEKNKEWAMDVMRRSVVAEIKKRIAKAKAKEAKLGITK